MAISREEVQKVSLLARLRLSDAELEEMTAQLADILEYVELLGELDTDAVEPIAHAIDVTDVFRDDQVRPSLEKEAALANAPKHDGECYRVPAVLGDG
ncbi:MAG: Asp-tRNA(Asn)/Glu-tRNA(Gln) amidotransferase subunit GatC [Pirellulaceae bacterium]|nr:Asp-tRNA(Asn)/Glu-tRNA(Gln) amidotransferase subunit GatC [Pirellulaceae bacterium]